MREYSTQMEAARKGIVTKELEIVAKKERMTVEELMPLVAEGKVAICANKNHKCIDPEGVGSMLKTKINVNLGISRDCKDYDIEIMYNQFVFVTNRKHIFCKIEVFLFGKIFLPKNYILCIGIGYFLYFL